MIRIKIEVALFTSYRQGYMSNVNGVVISINNTVRLPILRIPIPVDVRQLFLQ